MANPFAPPAIDFSSLGTLANTYYQAQDQALQRDLAQQKRATLASLGDQFSSGNIDYGKVAGQLAGLGDLPSAISLMNIPAQREASKAFGTAFGGGMGGNGVTSPAPAAPAQRTSFDASSVPSFVAGAGQNAGLSPDYLPKVAFIESKGDPNAVSPTGAKGLFQFTGGTAKQYGLADPFDPQSSTDAAARLAVDNRNVLTKQLGRAPTDAELYLAHQQGAGGAAALLSNPDVAAVDALAPVYGGDRGRAAQAIAVNGGNPGMRAGEFAAKWTGKYDSLGGGQTAQATADDANMPNASGRPVQFAIPGQAGPAAAPNTPNEILQTKVPAMIQALVNPQLPKETREVGLKLLDKALTEGGATSEQKDYAKAAAQGYRGTFLDYQKELKGRVNVGDTVSERARIGKEYGLVGDEFKQYVLNGAIPSRAEKSPISVKDGETLIDPRTYQPVYTTPPKPVDYQRFETNDGRQIAWNPRDPSKTLVLDPGGGAPRPMTEEERRNFQVPNNTGAFMDQKGSPHVLPGTANSTVQIGETVSERLRVGKEFGLKEDDLKQYALNGKVPSSAEKAPTEGQSKDALFGTRMEAAHQILSDPAISTVMLSPTAMRVGDVPGIGNYLMSENAQKAKQAKLDFMTALLRKESGAAIAQSEFTNADKQYFPQPGDSASVVKQKAANRDLAIRGVKVSGPAVSERVQNSPSVTPKPPAPRAAPTVGVVEDGHRFKGGNPADPASWEPVAAQGPRT